MALSRDLKDLPRAAIDGTPGRQPDAEPRFAHLLASAWQHDDEEAQAERADRPTAKFWFSDAGKCARAISYKAAGIPRSNPMDLSGTWNVNLGRILHAAWQKALTAVYPDAEVEVRVGLDGLDASGYGDAIVRTEDRVIALELKSIGGYGFKDAIGKARRGQVPTGPKFEHVVQASLLGKAKNADEVVIVYLAKECLSANVASGMPEWARFCAEWTFTRDEYEPIAEAEIERVTGILRLVEDGQLAARKVPDPELPKGAEIVDPASSRWEIRDADGDLVTMGALWNGSYCSYCGWFGLCAKTKSGRISLGDLSEVVVEIAS
jgi:hypothetical protein